jgi:hypothetical protein
LSHSHACKATGITVLLLERGVAKNEEKCIVRSYVIFALQNGDEVNQSKDS